MPQDPFVREKFIRERTAAKKLAAEYFQRFTRRSRLGDRSHSHSMERVSGNLGLIFAKLFDRADYRSALVAWHALENDRAQREMIRAVVPPFRQ
jgi:hypothetical protein